jgi:uncharacterized protein
MPYKVEIRSLLESLSASRDVSGSFVAPDVELGQQTYSFDGPVSFNVHLTNAGAGIVLSGEARARVVTPCVRCLIDFTTDVVAEVEGFYVRPGHETEFPEEQEIEFIADDSTIDLEPAVTQSIVVELPFAPVHDAACKGICPVCGADRNVAECGCAKEPAPSAFDSLRDLDLEEEDGGS